MKLLLFILAAVAAYPVGRWLRDRPTLQLRAWLVIGFLPFISSLDMALISFGARPGDTHGFEVALIDWLVLSLHFARRGPARPLPFRLAIGAYLLAVLLAATQAPWTLGALGYAWKLCRMILLYAALCRSDVGRRVPSALLRGLMAGLLYECLWTAWQHYGLGLRQAPGTFAHQNTLGILVNLVVMAPIALILAGRPTWLTRLAPLAALPICLFTVSRGALLFLGAGGVLAYVGSSIRSFDLRKARLGALGLALGLALVPLALTTLGVRPTGEQEDSMRLRERYERAAALMLEEHPLGVGPNHFTLMLLSGGYGERAGVDWSQRVAIVHNVYWLTAAEMGYPGLLALVGLFLAPLATAVRLALRAGADRRGDILLGLCVGLVVLYAHSFFEWAWRTTEISYVYWMSLGLTALLVRQLQERAPRASALPAGRWPRGVTFARS